jgi:hypothetical protein
MKNQKGKSNPAYRHGHSLRGKEHPIHRSWRAMIERCFNPHAISYPNYGGRGIHVVERWKIYPNFLEDMGHCWKPGLSLNRIDNNGPYSPPNCSWATRTEQNRNSRHNTLITAYGQTCPVSVWAEKFHINKNTFLARLRRGWSPEKCLAVPVDHRKGAYKVKRTP